MNILIEELPLPQRLALTYAPKRNRPATLALFALDAKFARIMSNSTEPLLVQMRLAWWRDQLTLPREDRPSGDPLLALLGDTWGGAESPLIALIDGWEGLLAEKTLEADDASGFASGRATAFVGLAGKPSCDDDVRTAARVWSLIDLQSRLSDEGERAMLDGLIVDAIPSARVKLPRTMRPLYVLYGLAIRKYRMKEPELVGSRGSVAAALRLGLLGR